MSSSIPNSKDKVYAKVKVMFAYVRHPMETNDKGLTWGHNVDGSND